MKIETIITAAIGGAAGILGGILAYIKFFVERKDKREAEKLEAILDKKFAPVQQELAERHKENEALKKELHEIRLDTTRTQLLMLMQHQSTNHDTILKIAHRYFVELGGDWYMSFEFNNWATSQKIEIPSAISQAIAENDSK